MVENSLGRFDGGSGIYITYNNRARSTAAFVLVFLYSCPSYVGYIPIAFHPEFRLVLLDLWLHVGNVIMARANKKQKYKNVFVFSLKYIWNAEMSYSLINLAQKHSVVHFCYVIIKTSSRIMQDALQRFNELESNPQLWYEWVLMYVFIRALEILMSQRWRSVVQFGLWRKSVLGGNTSQGVIALVFCLLLVP